MTKEARNDLIGNLAWGVGILAVALAGSLARKAGHVDSETLTRVVIGLTGLMIVWQGNRLPKTFVPHACAGKARRVAGWSLVLSGLVYAALFVFAPIPVACWGGAAAVLTGIAVTLGYCLTLRGRAKAA